MAAAALTKSHFIIFWLLDAEQINERHFYHLFYRIKIDYVVVNVKSILKKYSDISAKLIKTVITIPLSASCSIIID